MFTDRAHAGQLLAKFLLSQFQPGASYGWIVVGLADGGIPVAAEVAKAMKLPLGIVVCKEVTTPRITSYAVGVVSADGLLMVNPDVDKLPGMREFVMQAAEPVQQQAMAIEEHLLNQSERENPDVAGKSVLLVVDGIVDHMMTQIAVGSLQRRGARAVAVATPIISEAALKSLQQCADSVFALQIDPELTSVVAQYEHPELTEDLIVQAIQLCEASTVSR